MSTVRVHKDKGYFLASNVPFNDKQLSWESRGIMGYLLSKPDGWQCRSYDLINQTSAGKHVIKRVMNELQGAGYVHRFRKSEGRNTIKWITEVYETPALNPYLSKAENPAIEKDGVEDQFFDIESYDDEKPGSIVITDSINDLSSKKTYEKLSANADYSHSISLLSEKEIKALKLPLSTWKEYLTDEQAERGRKGIIKFLEAKIAIGPLLPDTPEAHLLFGRLAAEAEAQGRNGPQKFPSLACKEKFNRAVNQLNGTFEQAINSGLEAGILGIPRLVQYISSSKWKETTDGQSRTKNTQERFSDRSQSDTKKDTRTRDFEPGNGRTPEMQAKLEAAFAPK